MVDLVFQLDRVTAKLSGRWDRRAALGRAVERRPDNPRAMWALAILCFRAGDDDEAAEALLRRTIALSPRHLEAWLRLAQTVERRGRLDEAFTLYHELLALDPTDPHAAFGVGHILTVRGDIPQAIAFFERAWSNKPDYAEAVYRIAQCYSALGERARVAPSYRQALEIKPDYAEAMLALGDDHASQGESERALALHRRALEIKPDYAEAMLALGDGHASRNERDQARTLYRRALEIKPDYAEAMLALGDDHVGRTEIDLALALYRRALEIKPDYAEALLAMAKLHTGPAERDRAIALARRALELKPGYPDAALLIAERLLETAKERDAAGDRAEGMRLAEAALEARPGHVEAMMVLGALCASAEDLRRAEALLSRVAESDEAPLIAFRHLAQTRFRLGEREGALETMLRGFGLPESPRRFALAAPGAGGGPTREMAEPGARITIATSMMPRRLEVQTEAIASWRALGFDIVSVNTGAEIATLAPLFPEVRFIEPPVTAQHISGRPLILIDSLMAALAAAAGDLCGIVNSDIVIRPDPAFRRAIERESRGALVFGHRMDLDDLENDEGKRFSGGYDFFFFEKAAIPCFTGTELVLGMPWWDFWTPMAARLAGLAVKKLEAPMVLHQVHPVGYQERFFHGFSRVFLTAVGRLIDRLPEAAATADEEFLRRFYTSVAVATEPPLETEAARVEALCAFTNFLIDATAATITTG